MASTRCGTEDSPAPLQIVNSYWSDSDEDLDASMVTPPEITEQSALRETSDTGEPRINETSQPAGTDSSEKLEEVEEKEQQQEEEEDDEEEDPEEDSEAEDQLRANCSKVRGRKYAMRLADLPQTTQDLIGQVKKFFTENINLQRRARPISQSTMCKAQERILCFVGYLSKLRGVPKDKLTTSAFSNSRWLEDYFNYLDDVRKLSASTTANHVSSLLYVLKYLNRDRAPDYTGIPLIAQLRRLATTLQRQGDAERPSTTEELRAVGKWLSWDEILDCLKLQRLRVDTTNGLTKAKEAMNLLLIALYTHLPPARGLEIRSLVLFEEDEEKTFVASNFPKANVLVRSCEGTFKLVFQDFKTAKSHGRDLISIEIDSELHGILSEYLNSHRRKLSLLDNCDDGKYYLFLNAHGKPYSGPSFTKHLKKIFSDLSGAEISINCLRSAFITYAYSQSNCTDTMKESLASALRHSTRQAQFTYDKRNKSQKTQQALSFARFCAESEAGPSNVNVQEPEANAAKQFEVGDFVAVVQEGSTVAKPKILLGRITHYMTSAGHNQVILLRYESIGSCQYKLDLSTGRWIEPESNLFAVKVKFSNKADIYKLITSARSIHKSKHCDR